jgi:SAM-dependent methyltransferase
VSAAQDRLADIARYYDSKVLAFGATALGVDWPSLPSIHARLLKLLEIGDFDAGTSLNDLGCGWGAALDVLGHLHPRTAIDYFGIDVAPAMIEAARERWARSARTQFIVGSRCPRVADYTIASGIFNVKLRHATIEWERHVRETLADLHRCSVKGFAVNFMLPTAARRRAAELYCCEPGPWADFCAALPGRRVHVAPSPELAEFTLLVR